MKNTIEVFIEFSFKGETYNFNETLDLDAIMAQTGKLFDIHLYLANRNDIDTYSYLYDAMCSYPINFRNPSGLASQFIEENDFNIPGFEQAWYQQSTDRLLDDIINNHLGQIPGELQDSIKAALLEAYNAGKASSNT